MKSNSATPILVRISKLEERLREKPKTRWDFLKDSSKVISVSAFIISMITTIYSWRKDDLQAHEAARRQFDATMQQLVDIGLKNFEFTAKNKKEPNFGAMAGWFNAQSGLMGNRALQDLAAINDASMFDYILVGNSLLNVAQPARASALFKKAIDIGEQKQREHEEIPHIIMSAIQRKLFGEKLDTSLSDEQRVHDLSSAYVSLGQSLLAENKIEEAKQAYGDAIRTYEGSSQTDDIKRNAIAFIHKFWAEAIVNVDCKSSIEQLHAAADYLPDAKKVAENLDWASIQYELTYGTTHCGADGKMHGDSLDVAASPSGDVAPPSLMWPPSEAVASKSPTSKAR